jgi:signal transduction histidine kinase
MSAGAGSTGRWLAYTLRSRGRAVFADLGRASAILAFVIAVTALKFSAYNLPTAGVVAEAKPFARDAIALLGALAIAVPLLVAGGNLAPAAGLGRLVWIGVATSLAVLSCFVSPFPALVGVTFYPNRIWQVAALVAGLALVFEFRHRALATAGVLLRTEIDDVTADAQLRAARLQVLQAQVAPHFLFNALANVRRLAQIDRGAAAAMLGDLAHYFSITLAQRDEPLRSLGDESRLVDAYLRIHRVRMGTRLAYAIEVPQELAWVPVPSMMLLTLVENSIKHGIDPLTEGGFVRLLAERRGTALRLEVADNGRGLSASEGYGTGLANVRSRLSMLYGARAQLVLGHGRPRGFVASVLLPVPEN